MGQIPLRRGDNDSTAWAMDMATRTLDDGNKVGLYPEGTRSPDGVTMHRLHRRVLIPMLEANPDAPVHAIATTYPAGGRFRRRAVVRISPRLDIDTRTMAPNDIMDVVREALISAGGLTYVDTYAQAVKGARRPDAGA
jgi:1-acyl-sn-glycerol-3-phosphate acyltransferase